MTCSTTLNYKPFSHLARPREVIRQFTPNWFAATMGTGVLALALAQLPVNLPGMYAIAEGLWRNINLKNLMENILPTRPRADLILRKGKEHLVEEVALRKL